MTTRNIKQNSKRKSKGKKPWEYVGEFIWHFGTIESYINEIFLSLFDLERVSFMFIGLIDTRKKLQLIKIGFGEKGDGTHDLVISQLNEMATLRNVIVHSCFHHAQDGINIDHITHHGTRWLSKKGEDYISYEDFERIFERQKEIIEQLAKIYDTTTPISSFSRDFVAAIDEIIDSSPNVIRYAPRRPQMDK